ncbi:PAS domain-containing protein [Hyalangium rubrum]|uniref:histidine kinase n=1 Tax=Hyalangium rubrum TaxID=3103134 RepID=A0ABU5HCN2_9BACT|nr:PAS domain-containing protein [Hyalangium sp. s54d21]MDY7231001.1 PAS domain-containing protein [Hyalangium sp. s54d21]
MPQGTFESTPESLDGYTVAQRLRERKAEIIEAYVSAARSELEAARTLDWDGLVDSLPELIDNLADALQQGESVANLQESARIGMKHGQIRAHQNAYSLNAVLIEYRLLSRVIFTVLRQGGRLEFQTEDIIHDALHRGVANSASEFTRIRSKVEQEYQAERERVLQELQTARSLLEAVIRHLPVGVSVTDARTESALVRNEEVERLIERPVSERKTAEEFALYGAIHADGSPYAVGEYPTVRAIRKGETVRDEEMLYRRLDGTVSTLVVNSTPIRDGHGNITVAVTTVYDLTERRRLEIELQNSRQELRDFFMQAPVALCILSGPEHVFTLANPLYLQMVGRDPIGKKVREAFTEEEAGKFFKILDEVYRTGIPYIGKEQPFPRQKERGEAARFSLTLGYHPFRGGDGRIKGILAIIQDVTEQVRARQQVEESEAALRQAMEQLRIVADSVPIHLCHLDRDERFLFMNKAAAEMWHLPPEQFVGKTIRQVAGDETQRALHPYTLQVLQGEIVSYESPFHAPDGSVRTFLNTYTPQFAPDGTVRGFLVAGTDITDRKKSEEALRKSLVSLQEERELRERFVSTLAHDLRTPLTAAKMSSHLLSRGADDPARLQKLASRIADNIDRADQLIRDMLDTSRLKAGEKLPLELERCCLNEVAKQVLEELSTIHGDRFVLRAASTIEGFWSCGAIRRILENLCGNGVKYGAPHRPVTVSLKEEGGAARLQVHNEGMPIPETELPNLFEPFHRSSTARASGERGWGLGLSLVKGLAEAHGGTVSVSSSEEQGTVFTVVLPISQPG